MLLTDRLRDFDILSRLLGRDILKDIEMTYLSIKYTDNLDIDASKAVLKVKCTDDDLEMLDDYYKCPLEYKRVLVCIDNAYIAWVYIKNRSEIAVQGLGK